MVNQQHRRQTTRDTTMQKAPVHTTTLLIHSTRLQCGDPLVLLFETFFDGVSVESIAIRGEQA